MSVDSITKAQWRVRDLERDLAHANQSLSLARSEVETVTEQLKGTKAALAQLRKPQLSDPKGRGRLMPRGHTIKGGDSATILAEHALNAGWTNDWRITYHEDRDSSWYHAETIDGDAKFDRANLTDLVEICKILNGAKPPWRS